MFGFWLLELADLTSGMECLASFPPSQSSPTLLYKLCPVTTVSCWLSPFSAHLFSQHANPKPGIPAPSSSFHWASRKSVPLSLFCKYLGVSAMWIWLFLAAPSKVLQGPASLPSVWISPFCCVFLEKFWRRCLPGTLQLASKTSPLLFLTSLVHTGTTATCKASAFFGRWWILDSHGFLPA